MTDPVFRYRPSPHCNARPEGVSIDLLVLHAISLPPGFFGGCAIDDFFLGRLDVAAHPFFQEIASLKVSAHFVIDRQGAVTQYVPVHGRAWHAGVSVWEGRENCNDFSIGVELEGDADTPFEMCQYNTLASLIARLQSRLPALREERIVGHQHIAPTRKWDPGPTFDWSELKQRLRHSQPNINWPVRWEA
ncbi:MAG: 1,6-anhydro-N-acetylmuramyl-L-alanine amidase AmpD [Magnetococcales bacterium]|nr:1,6-anhydro-N-acetylmuramyl-L-alanine amidase AmpD [Magnetococcales bacterium]